MECAITEEERTLAVLLGFTHFPTTQWKNGEHSIWWDGMGGEWVMRYSTHNTLQITRNLYSLKDALLYWNQHYGNQS